MGQVMKAVCHCVRCHYEDTYDKGFELISDGRNEVNLCKKCYYTTCEWCLQSTLGVNETMVFNNVFSSCVIRSMGGGYAPICRSCTIAVINQEIEDIKNDVYEGVQLLDHDDPNSGNRLKMEMEVLLDVCFMGLN